jgi:hypothetical protein
MHECSEERTFYGELKQEKAAMISKNGAKEQKELNYPISFMFS